MVAGSRRECRQQQCGVHRPVQPGPPRGIGRGRIDTDTTRRHATGVEHDHDSPVAFWPPRADHDVGATRGCAPVDGADVIADDILTQRIEFSALPAYQRRQQPIDLPQFGKPRRQVFARQERRQHPDLTGHRLRTLPSRQSQRPDRSGGYHGRALVAAANRAQDSVDMLALPGGDVDGVGARLRARTRRPGVADPAAESAPAVVVDQQPRIHLLGEPGRGVR